MLEGFTRGLLLIIVGALLLSNTARAQTPNGTWLMQNGKAEVTISSCANALCGWVSRVIKYPKDGARTDIHNGNAALRNRPLLKLPVLLNLKGSGGAWKGRVYDPKSGREYQATLTQVKADELTIRACLLFICKTQQWARVKH